MRYEVRLIDVVTGGVGIVKRTFFKRTAKKVAQAIESRLTGAVVVKIA